MERTNMTTKEMDVLIDHCNRHFKQNDVMVMHNDQMRPHVDILRYPPSKACPYWKLVTMGASDYLMPNRKNSLGRRNEYVIFVDPEEPLYEMESCLWYMETLLTVALYPRQSKLYLSYSHSMEWGEEEGSDMVGAFLEFPQLIEDVSFLRCKLGFLKEAVILQPVFLTRAEVDKALEMGPEAFSNWMYPEGEEKAHFLCQRHRTESF